MSRSPEREVSRRRLVQGALGAGAGVVASQAVSVAAPLAARTSHNVLALWTGDIGIRPPDDPDAGKIALAVGVSGDTGSLGKAIMLVDVGSSKQINAQIVSNVAQFAADALGVTPADINVILFTGVL